MLDAHFATTAQIQWNCCTHCLASSYHFTFHKMHFQCTRLFFSSGQFICGNCLAAFYFQPHYSTLLPYTRERGRIHGVWCMNKAILVSLWICYDNKPQSKCGTQTQAAGCALRPACCLIDQIKWFIFMFQIQTAIIKRNYSKTADTHAGIRRTDSDLKLNFINSIWASPFTLFPLS